VLQRALAAAAVMLMSVPAGSLAQTAADYYFWQPVARDGAARPWAVVLPGSSGLSIFDDNEHYFRAAIWLNGRGVDALVIDYHGAAGFVPEAREGPPGDRVAAIVADALRVQRAEGRMLARCPGGVIGWSLGAAGALTLAASKSRDRALRAAAVFYPALVRPNGYRNDVPILALQGTNDNVMPEDELRAFAAGRADGSAPFEIVAFEGAANGFDVPSLLPARERTYPSGLSQTFAYNAEAARMAQAALERFLREHGIVGGTCTAN
jgi:dienelactone hydrolase